ncbi:hypothetical protein ACFV99_13945 [Streptomyces sp. NPDC059944]|jgi:hypothetical protein|uniref:hypothetical protein n=1 Tax=unclassified Streptomyces TaxID=2593676 RepID=UPI003659E9F4
MTTYEPYSADSRWTFSNRLSRHEFTVPLRLYWEVNGDPLTDDYTPDDMNAAELWEMWFSRYWKGDPAKIYWFISGGQVFEGAPFSNNIGGHDHFLTHFTWPVNSVSGEPVNWVRLPVRDKLWNKDHGDKGGFIQELTGWKPSPFQASFDAEKIARLAGLMGTGLG